MSALPVEPDRPWPDVRVTRMLDQITLSHAAETIESSFPAHIWPQHRSGEARALSPDAVQAGFVEGVRFACDQLRGMANEAGDIADTLAKEEAEGAAS